MPCSQWREKCFCRSTAWHLFAIQGDKREHLRAESWRRSHNERMCCLPCRSHHRPRRAMPRRLGPTQSSHSIPSWRSGLLQVAGTQRGWLDFSDRLIGKCAILLNVGARVSRNATYDMVVFAAGIEGTGTRIARWYPPPPVTTIHQLRLQVPSIFHLQGAKRFVSVLRGDILHVVISCAYVLVSRHWLFSFSLWCCYRC